MQNNTRPVVYLACPYSDPRGLEETINFETATITTQAMRDRGELVYSPITEGHATRHLVKLVGGGDIGGNWQAWQAYARAMIARLDEIAVVNLPEAEHSVGVHAEIAYAREIGKPVRFVKAFTGLPCDPPAWFVREQEANA